MITNPDTFIRTATEAVQALEIGVEFAGTNSGFAEFVLSRPGLKEDTTLRIVSSVDLMTREVLPPHIVEKATGNSRARRRLTIGDLPSVLQAEISRVTKALSEVVQKSSHTPAPAHS